jgi:ABC-type spermidine/putrescine transport system permease subunit II
MYEKYAKLGKVLAKISIGLIVLFLLAPLAMIVIVSFNPENMFQFPPENFSFDNYVYLFEDERVFSSIGLSLVVGLVATVLASLVGLCAAVGIVRGRLPAKQLLESLFLGPLIVPLVTLGIGFLLIFVPLGIVGSKTSIIFAHSIVIAPYMVRILLASMRQLKPVLEEAAIVHGATPGYTFLTVVLPQLFPALISGAILSFLVSLDEYTVTVFLTEAETVTLPLQIYQFVSVDINPIVTALASVMVVIAFVVISVLEKRLQIHKYL